MKFNEKNRVKNVTLGVIKQTWAFQKYIWKYIQLSWVTSENAINRRMKTHLNHNSHKNMVEGVHLGSRPTG